MGQKEKKTEEKLIEYKELVGHHQVDHISTAEVPEGEERDEGQRHYLKN